MAGGHIMASLDPYLKLAAEKQAKQLILRPNQKPVLVFSDNDHTPFGQPIHASQIKVAIAELLSGDNKARFMNSGQIRVDYSFNGQTFRIATRISDIGVEAAFVNLTLAQTSSKLAADEEAVRASVEGGNDPKHIHFYLYQMAQRKASDLHLCAGRTPKFRIDGDITTVDNLPVLDADGLAALIFRIAPADGEKTFKETGSVDFAYTLDGVGRFRVNIYKEYQGLSTAIRMIPQTVLTAEQLNLPPAVRRLAHLPKGLVVVTGPTGSGKSTTLAAIVDLVNRQRAQHILTIEAPIEFLHKDQRCIVHQREVGVHTGSFKDALRDALREDPDVVLVGEMRDLETISIAIETAATGHLVFGTLHTTTAPSTVNRIIDSFPSDQQAQIRYSLAESLKAVIAQNLLKKKGGGRVAVQEILMVSKPVSNLIRESKTHQLLNVMQTGKNLGMQLFNEELLKLVRDNVVEASEAYAKAVDKDDIVQMFAKNGIPFEAPKDAID
jgi:twitching motility protein PilT